MNKFARISTALLMATTLGTPLATGLAQAATVNTGAPAIVDAVPANQILSIIGWGSSADIAALSKGDEPVNIIHVGDVYTGKTLSDVTDALKTTKRSAVMNVRSELQKDPAARAWFAGQGLDVNSVLAVDHQHGKIDVYLS